jgi:DNA-binding beta-propeller fold protein YncE
MILPALAFADGFPTAEHSTHLVLDDDLSLPSDVGVGTNGKIYVVNGGNHEVAVFDSAGQRTATLGEQGSEPGELFQPVGIGVGPKGEIYVADKGNQRLQRYSRDGELERAIPLQEDGDDVSPVDVAVSASGKELYVTANNSHRVLVFSNKGNFLRGWGGEGDADGEFRYPATLELDSAGNVLVVDVLNQRVQKFDPEGEHLLNIGGLGGKPGSFYRPKGIALDNAGRIYVSDSFLGVVQVFDANGKFLHVLGSDGTSTVFETPVGMITDGARLLVVEMLAGKVLLLDIAAPMPAEGESQP